MKDALDLHDAVVREAIEREGGNIFKTLGDAFATAFAEHRASPSTRPSRRRWKQ